MSLKLNISLLESIPIPLLVIGADRHIEAINASFGRLMGHHLLGRHFITALRQPKLVSQIESVFASGQPKVAPYTHRANAIVTNFDVHISPVETGLMLAFQDRSVEDETLETRRAFVANVSHELRTPLTALSGFIETLKGAAKDDPIARVRFLDIMQAETERMTRLVDDLLSLSRVEHEIRVPPTQKVDLVRLVDATIAHLDPVLVRANAEIDFSKPDGLPKVTGDAAQLRQVVGNLIENAVNYSGEKPRVSVSIAGPMPAKVGRGDVLRLTVTDRGNGIAAHHIPRLTERFYRIDTHRARDDGGTGLGLAIVKHIVNRHRGVLDIVSDVGCGTSVSVSLPIFAA